MANPIPVHPQTVYFHGQIEGVGDVDPLAVLRAFIQRFQTGTYRYVWGLEPGATVPQDLIENPDIVFVPLLSFENQIELRRAKYIVHHFSLPADFAAQPQQIILCTAQNLPLRTVCENSNQELCGLYHVHRSINVSDIILNEDTDQTQQAISSHYAPLNETAVYKVRSVGQCDEAHDMTPPMPHPSEQAINLLLNFARAPQAKTKHQVLLFGGSFKQNGMTTSLINLTKMVDYDRIELFIAVRPANLDDDPARKDLFLRLDPRVKVLLWQPGAMLKSDKDWISGVRHPKKRTNRGQIIARLLNRFAVVAQRHWRDHAFDAIVVFTGYSGAANLIALSANAPRKAIFLHNDMAAEIEQKNNVSWIIRQTYKHFDKVVSVSPALMKINGKKLRADIPQQKEAFCRNTLDHVELRTRAEKACDVADDMRRVRADAPNAKVYVHIGRFSHEKNHRLLLDAFHQVLETAPQAQLWLVGNGQLYDEIVAYANDLKIAANVHFTGWLDNPAPALKEADVFVLSSLYEGQPMVLLEAMTLDVCCVAVESPQVRYVLKDGAGLMTAPTKDDLASGMLEAVNGSFTPAKFDPVAYNADALNDFYDVIGLPR